MAFLSVAASHVIVKSRRTKLTAAFLENYTLILNHRHFLSEKTIEINIHKECMVFHYTKTICKYMKNTINEISVALIFLMCH